MFYNLNYAKDCRHQRLIQNPVKYLRRVLLLSVLDVSHGSDYTADIALVKEW